MSKTAPWPLDRIFISVSPHQSKQPDFWYSEAWYAIKYLQLAHLWVKKFNSAVKSLKIFHCATSGFISLNKTFLIQASDIRMIQGTTSEQILQQSQEVIETNGEWELADITVAPSTLALEDGDYSEIKFHVSTLNYPKCSCEPFCPVPTSQGQI